MFAIPILLLHVVYLNTPFLANGSRDINDISFMFFEKLKSKTKKQVCKTVVVDILFKCTVRKLKLLFLQKSFHYVTLKSWAVENNHKHIGVKHKLTLQVWSELDTCITYFHLVNYRHLNFWGTFY